MRRQSPRVHLMPPRYSSEDCPTDIHALPRERCGAFKQAAQGSSTFAREIVDVQEGPVPPGRIVA
jgi:hypothetical protein